MGGKARGPGPRSFELLRWLERVEVAGLEPLGLGHRLGDRAVYSHVQRLADASLVVRIYDRDGSLVAITKEGRRAVRPDIVNARPPRGGLVRNVQSAHGRAVSWVAAWSTLRGHEWVSDREMRSLPAWHVPVIWSRRGAHRPDHGLRMGAGPIAVEVELTAKSPGRLRAILSGYENAIFDGRFAAVIYVCDDPAVARGVGRAARQVGIDRRHLRLWTLDDLKRQTRELAAGPTFEPVRDRQKRHSVSEIGANDPEAPHSPEGGPNARRDRRMVYAQIRSRRIPTVSSVVTAATAAGRLRAGCVGSRSAACGRTRSAPPA